MNHVCPNCGSPGMRVFYESRSIPVHSCLMLQDRDAARDFPRGQLALGFCDACGFVSNVRYDAAVQAYSSAYEDQQSYSAKFRAFQTGLIDDLTARYNLRGKTILEIGCSKGDFLIELCQRSGSQGIGIDPSAIPGRVDTGGADVRFIADHYSEKYTSIDCDVVCCRHTLEHIGPTGDFIHMVRQAVGDRPDTLVFFEVPDVGRVLREGAFWDIYYEHCSYFTLGSLARVFRANHFDVIELAKDYDDQYLLLLAYPVDRPTEPRLPEENDLEQTRAEVADFTVSVQRRIANLKEQVSAAARAGRRPAIWGSGSKCVSFLSTLGITDEIDKIVDINPHRHGKYLAGSGRQVFAPESLIESPPQIVFIMNPIYRDEIADHLHRMGLHPELVPV